jgi:hypothetical protein
MICPANSTRSTCGKALADEFPAVINDSFVE